LTKFVVVINPNSNSAITHSMAMAVDHLNDGNFRQVDCVTLDEGPFGIESQADVDQVIAPMGELIAANQTADAFVIGCYSDPGIDILRTAESRPIVGIQHAAVETALTHGDRFGVIALSDQSIARHLVYLENLGYTDKLARELPLDMSVAEANQLEARPRIIELAMELRSTHNATAIILGCTGMAIHREAVELAVGLPTIDPTQAAVSLAFSRL
jgi:Asp/Glu/hydantoin racemase